MYAGTSPSFATDATPTCAPPRLASLAAVALSARHPSGAITLPVRGFSLYTSLARIIPRMAFALTSNHPKGRRQPWTVWSSRRNARLHPFAIPLHRGGVGVPRSGRLRRRTSPYRPIGPQQGTKRRQRNLPQASRPGIGSVRTIQTRRIGRTSIQTRATYNPRSR